LALAGVGSIDLCIDVSIDVCIEIRVGLGLIGWVGPGDLVGGGELGGDGPKEPAAVHTRRKTRTNQKRSTQLSVQGGGWIGMSRLSGWRFGARLNR